MSDNFWLVVSAFVVILGYPLLCYLNYLWKESEYKSYRKEREAVYKQEAEAVKRFNEYQRTLNNEAID